MTFKEYQKKSRRTAIYPRQGNNFIYPTLGLVGEAGEIADKISKVFRDDDEKITAERKKELEKELGDVLWYFAQLATEIGLSMEAIAAANLTKLASRQKRKKLSGSGDNR